MNLGELRALARNRLQDTVTPYGWRNSDLNSFINTAVVEATERSRLIFDSSTPAVTQISVTPFVADYQLHPSVQSIVRARADTGQVDAQGNPIYTTVIPGSRTDLSVIGFTPRDNMYTNYSLHYWRDYEGIHLAPIPEKATTLLLEVYRAPLDTEKLVLDTDIPPIPDRLHRYLVHWVLYEAYSVNDADLSDPTKALKELAQFERHFSNRASAKLERMMQEGKGGKAAYSRPFGG